MPMRSLAVRPSASRVPTRPLVVLTACLAVAGLGLGWLMVRAVLQERAIAAREQREAAESAARRLADAIPGELERLARDIVVPDTPDPYSDDGGGMSGPAAHGAQPTGADDEVLLLVGAHDVRVWPEHRLLYTIGTAAPDAEPPASPSLRAAEQLELRARDYPAAVAAYRSLLAATPQPAQRLELQRRLARTLRKAARPADALVVLSEIVEAHPGPGPGEVAAASFDRCALLRERPRPEEATACATSLYDDLIDARWRLDRERYQFYAYASRDWLDAQASTPALAALRRREANRLALTEATARTLEAWRERKGDLPSGHLVEADEPLPVLAVWRTTAPGEHALLVLGPSAASARVWQPLALLTTPDHRVSVSADGVEVFPRTSSSALAGETDAPSASATSSAGAIVWRVDAIPEPARSRRTGLSLASNLYLGTLGLMVCAVALAGYFAIRTVRKELEVARSGTARSQYATSSSRLPTARLGRFGFLLTDASSPSTGARLPIRVTGTYSYCRRSAAMRAPFRLSGLLSN